MAPILIADTNLRARSISTDNTINITFGVITSIVGILSLMVAVAAAIRESRGRLGGSGLQDRPSQLISNFNQSQGRMRILGLKHRDYSIKQRGPTYAEGEGSEDDKNFSKVVG